MKVLSLCRYPSLQCGHQRSSFTTVWRSSSCSGRWAGPQSCSRSFSHTSSPGGRVVPHRAHCLRYSCPHQVLLCSKLPPLPLGCAGKAVAGRTRPITLCSPQVCSIKFGSWINSQYNVEYRLPRDSAVGLGDFQQTVGWEVVNTKSR